MKDSGAHIEIFSAKDQSLTFLVTGKTSEVIEARRKILIHFQTQASKHISIPREHHRWILGKKGDRLREVEKDTATKINVPNISEESDVITITGTKEGIEKAEHEIRTMADEQSKKAFERISVPKHFHPFIFGPFSENLSKLTEETGARINIPPPSVMKDEIIITGEKEGVFQAIAQIENIHKEMEKKCTTVCVEVPKSQHKYVVGPRGSTIQEILKITGVSVEMPPTDSMTDTITLRGPHDKLGTALSTVYEKANSVRSCSIDAPAWIHKFIIGRKGANIKELSAEFTSVNVEFKENQIKIEGPPEETERACACFEKIVNDYVTKLNYVDMIVNPKHYKHIIGKNGANINRLKDEFDVTINIDEKDGLNRIRIEGPFDGVQKAQIELEDKISKLDNEIEKILSVDRKLFRNLRGVKGENLREIREKFTQVQIQFPQLNDESDAVKIRGPKDEVDKCYKYLTKYVKDVQENSFVLEVPIFKQLHKFIIGKAGANIKKIRDETQTRIDLPAEGDKNDVIIITGKKENVLDARERIQKIKNELADIIMEEITIPPKYYNSIIGTGGKLISSIMEECGGVSIKFPTSDSKSDKVTIRGQKEDVEKAKLQLLELSSKRELLSFTAEVRSKQQHHKYLIGKSGASIKKIRDNTGARIVFPGINDEDKDLITIIGKKESVEAAKSQLEQIIKDIDNITEGEMIVDPKYHKHFVGRRGELLLRIADECGGVSISFPRQGQDNSKVTLKGAKEFIEAAKQRIEEIVDDLENMVTIECIIPQRHHRMVMGPKGSKVQFVTSEFDVQIKFPDREIVDPNAFESLTLNGGGEEGAATPNDEVAAVEEQVRPGDIIRITGKLEKCEAAREALLKHIPIVEEMTVPFDLHRSIIGQKGRYVRELMTKYDVHIELSPPEKKLDTIKISGTAENVEGAKKAIAERVEELEGDRKDRELRSFELQIEVDPEYHPKIIGRRGVVVNEIRSKHGVQISFPKREDAIDNVITIQGYEASTAAARDDIMKIVGDLSDQVKITLSIDSRVHPRLIGQRGRSIHKIMEDYKVEVKFPRSGDSDPDLVTIVGTEENVAEAKDHLLNLEEEYLQDVTETAPSSTNAFSDVLEVALNRHGAGERREGFVVQGAPWQKSAPNTESHEDFPDFGIPPAVAERPSISSAWGPRN